MDDPEIPTENGDGDDDDDKFSYNVRTLTNEEIRKLESDTKLMSEFQQNRLEKYSQKNWDLFYKRNQDKFFRNRNWILNEFPELSLVMDDDPNHLESARVKTLLEAGCGVGNFIWPLLNVGLKYRFYACDFSPRALDLFRKNDLYDENKCHVFQADLTEPNGIISRLEQMPDVVGFDFVSLIFVLSSIHPDKMLIVLKNIREVLADDGMLIFRDYGLYDHSMIRYSSGHKLSDKFYARQDGTRTYYFTIEKMAELADESGLQIIQLAYVERRTVNIKENISVPRVFLQGKFKKKKKNLERSP